MAGEGRRVTFWPLRSRVTGIVPRREPARRRSATSATAVPTISSCHVQLVTACCNEVSPRSITAAASTSSPVAASGEPAGQRVDLHVSGLVGPQIDVEVLAERLVAGGQRQAEVHLRAGREALGYASGNAARRSARSQEAGDVAMAGEADLPELREPEPDPHASTAHTAGRSVIGTSPPVSRSWPVPCEPPAGGVAEATMCSIE